MHLITVSGAHPLGTQTLPPVMKEDAVFPLFSDIHQDFDCQHSSKNSLCTQVHTDYQKVHTWWIFTCTFS